MHLERPGFENVAARSLALTLRSNGTAIRHSADADLHVQALAFDGGDVSDDRVVLSVALDRELPSLRLHLDTEGRATAKLSASVSFDRSRRAVPYEIDGRLADLAPLAPFVSRVRGLEGFDLSKLDLAFSSKGDLLGVVSSVARDGTIGLEPHPTLTAAVDGQADLRVKHLRWTGGDTAIVAPAAAWQGELHVVGTRRTLDSHLDVDALHLGFGRNEVDLAGISDDGSAAVSGDLMNPEAEVTQRVAVRTVTQDAAPDYPVGDVAFTMSVKRDPEGLVQVADLKLVNGAGGTTLGLTGGLDLGTRRRKLSMTADLTQDLAPLSTAPDRFSGRGKVALQAKVESPDLIVFRTRLDLKVDDVHFRMPRAGVAVESFDGEIPVTATFEVARTGKGGAADKTTFRIRGEERHNRYSMLRFADQHPLLSRTGFLSIGSLKTPFVSIAPLVGNLEIEQNVISLRQFEMGLRGGKITGQAALDWEGPKSTLELHVRASGVQSSHGEPFDGNVAVVIAAGDRTVEGRAEIVRIGSRHLLDLLDMEDPMRADPAMNRIRTAMMLGYPDRLRLVFDHGFASAHLELGGLARLIGIDDLHGIPMGPIVDRFLAPVLDAKEGP